MLRREAAACDPRLPRSALPHVPLREASVASSSPYTSAPSLFISVRAVGSGRPLGLLLRLNVGRRRSRFSDLADAAKLGAETVATAVAVSTSGKSPPPPRADDVPTDSVALDRRVRQLRH